MKIDILTRNQAREYIKEEVARQLIAFYQDVNKLRKQINLMREEFICSKKE